MTRFGLGCLLVACAWAAEPAMPVNPVAPVPAPAGSADLRLPTENHYLLTGHPEKFYMYVDRTYEGVTSKPWQGGTFGFVRTPVKVNGQPVLRQFHEGIDIAPVKRDKAGNPLDLVSAIAAGTVVHTNPVSGRSNYGKYVVVAHDWENSPVYSLYAHLAEVSCKPGDPVLAGSLLGRMGYTGSGLSRTRAHLHLELGLMLNTRYEDWHLATGKGINHHGIHNGMNIAGADAAGFFLGRAKNPQLKFSEYLAATPVYFKVAVPATKDPPDLLVRCPWLGQTPPPTAATTTPPVSWEISFTATGLPTRIVPSQREVTAPVITRIRPSEIPHRFLTRYLVTGEGSTATLTSGGSALVNLITGDFPTAPAKPAPAEPAPAEPAQPKPAQALKTGRKSSG